MRQFGLIGFPLSHSFSKKYFNDKFLAEGIRDCHYENYAIESIDEFSDLIKNSSNLKGLNVTIPYKAAVIPYLDELDEKAASIGAVNTIRIENGKLTGYNTDIYGFSKSLEHLLPPYPIKALILGTGGASKAVAFVLEEFNIPFQYVSRSKGKDDILSYNSLYKRKVQSHQLIINTTPVGMFPDVEHMPEIPYNGIGEDHILYDLVYNPARTRFLEEGEKRGAKIKNGLEMLQLQAEKAWAIWNDF